MITELDRWVYCNGLLCRTAEALAKVTSHYIKRGEEISIVPVEKTTYGYKLYINDPMET